MRELGELLRRDAHDGERAANLCHVRGGRGDIGHAGAREGDLRRRAELVDEVVSARLGEGVEDVEERGVLLGESVDRVGVVPEDAEVGRRGMEIRERADDVVRVGDAGGVRVLGHAPDALDGGVGLDETHHHVHVGAVIEHGHRHVLEAVVRAHLEVPVVSGAGAEELDPPLLAPGLVAADAVRVGVAHEVVHEVEARGAVHDHVGGIDAHDLGGEGARGGQTVGHAVVVNGQAAVGERGRGVDEVEHGARERRLLGARLPAGHVELEAEGLQVLGVALDGGYGGIEISVAHELVCIGHGFLLGSGLFSSIGSPGTPKLVPCNS